MGSFPELYPPRARQQNIDLIKGIRFAASQQAFEQADQRFIAEYHPSLFAELDWMEMTMPYQQRKDGAGLVDELFIYHLQEIISRRRSEFERSTEELEFDIECNSGFYRTMLQDEQQPLQVLDRNLRRHIAEFVQNMQVDSNAVIARMCEIERPRLFRTLSGIEDQNWLLLMIEVEIKNAMAKSLDHVTSRMGTKQFLRKIGGQFPELQTSSIGSDYDLQALTDELKGLAQAAKRFSVYQLAAVCHALHELVADMHASSLNMFSGELAAGYGACGHCSMMYASSAIISFNPTCPRLFEGEDERIYFPTDFNVSVCPFCGEEARAEAPAMFYSPRRHQVIYNFPRLGQYSEEEARSVHRPLITALRQDYSERVSHEERARFETANEEFTYSAAEFLLAIQMGTTVKEEHVHLVVRLANGSGLIMDKTKGAIIGLTRTEMENQWAAARTVDIDDALRDEGLGGGVRVKEAMEAFAAGRFERSRDILEELHQRFPEDDVVRKNLAVAYISLGDRASAKHLFNMQ